MRDLKQHQVKRVSEYIQDNFTVGDNLKRELRENILTMIRLQTWRGTRCVASARTTGPSKVARGHATAHELRRWHIDALAGLLRRTQRRTHSVVQTLDTVSHL